MTSFNKINGVFAGGNHDLCTRLLRDEWRFEGVVVTDWGDMDDNYLDITADAFSEMHILIEGAIAIFENDTGPLNRLATQHKEYEERIALNDVGAALYTLRRHITRLQTAVHDESERLHAARKENHND